MLGAVTAFLQSGWEPIIRNTFTEGFLYVGLALGVYLALRVVGFPDLTVEGSFAWGGAVAAVTIAQWGWHPVLGTAAAFVAGFIPGIMTALLNRALYIADLVAGIITATFFFTVTRRFTGKATQPLGDSTIFDSLSFMSVGDDRTVRFVIILAVVGVGAAALVWWILNTQFGLGMRATGSSEPMATSVGVSATLMVVAALALGNGFVALSGALVTQRQGFSDVNMGLGVIVAGLGTVVLGEALFGNKSVLRGVIACVVGSLAYRFIVSFALGAGLQPSDIRGGSAVFLILILIAPNLKMIARKAVNRGPGPARPPKTILRRR